MAVRLDAPIVHAGGLHGDRPRADGHLPGAALPIADHQGVTGRVALGSMGLQVGNHLGLQGGEQHAASALAGDLIKQRAPLDLFVYRFVSDHSQHGRRLPPAACAGAAVDQAGEYAGAVTGSTIHNFRSYLAARADTEPLTDRRTLRRSALSATLEDALRADWPADKRVATLTQKNLDAWLRSTGTDDLSDSEDTWYDFYRAWVMARVDMGCRRAVCRDPFELHFDSPLAGDVIYIPKPLTPTGMVPLIAILSLLTGSLVWGRAHRRQQVYAIASGLQGELKRRGGFGPQPSQ